MGRIPCAKYILELLEQKEGRSTRKELRPYLIEKGYGTEAIRQAYLQLERYDKIRLTGPGRSPNQIVEIERGKDDV